MTKQSLTKAALTHARPGSRLSGEVTQGMGATWIGMATASPASEEYNSRSARSFSSNPAVVLTGDISQQEGFVIDWALSSQGTAVATWAANLLSTIALAIALSVAVVEQRRANREKLRAERDAATRRHNFIHTCICVLSEAQQLVDIEMDRFLPRDGYINTRTQGQAQHLLEPVLDAIEALWASAPPEGDIVLTLARAVRAFRDIIQRRGVDGDVPVVAYRNFLEAKQAELRRRAIQLSHLLANPGPLPEELSVLAEFR